MSERDGEIAAAIGIGVLAIILELLALLWALPVLINLHNDAALLAAIGVVVSMAIGGYIAFRLVADIMNGDK